jgi:outer membrane protein assembly factor BamA
MEVLNTMSANTPRRSAIWLKLVALFGALAQGLGSVNAEDSASLNKNVPQNPPAAALAPAAAADSPLWSPEDGWLDISSFVDKAYGFVPLAIPITEPAIGYGLGGALIFIDKPQGKEKAAGFGRPNLSGVGGMATENGTWGLGAFDLRHWHKDTVQTQVGGVYASVNLDFYGLSDDSILKEHPLSYNLEPLGGMMQVRYRLGNTRCWAGLNYMAATTQVRFDAPEATPGLPDYQKESRIAGLTPSFSYDSRNNVFTPTRGTYLEASLGLFSPTLGGDDDFQRGSVTLIQYLPLSRKWTVGVRADAYVSAGDVPFYMRPFVILRGAPAMRYQGESVVQGEAELRWQCWKRFSLVGFAGFGKTWSNTERFERTDDVTTGGAGFRYEIARKYGLHMGLDVAFGPDDEQPAIYIQFGSAWMRM